MNTPMMGYLMGILLVGTGSAQVVPATPKKFVIRPIGDGNSGGVEVIPKSSAGAKMVKYITHIVLSASRSWTSTEGKILEGKLIAFEDLVAEAPQGVAMPENPAPPQSPTVVRDDKVRLLVNQKPVEIPIQRLCQSDQQFIQQTKNDCLRKTPPSP